jgi:hypothetical protein
MSSREYTVVLESLFNFQLPCRQIALYQHWFLRERVKTKNRER